MSAPRCEHNFFRPFRLLVTLTQILDAHGEPTDHVEIEGLRQGGMRTRIVTYARLLEQADVLSIYGWKCTTDLRRNCTMALRPKRTTPRMIAPRCSSRHQESFAPAFGT
jgi:hypothetical protein